MRFLRPSDGVAGLLALLSVTNTLMLVKFAVGGKVSP